MTDGANNSLINLGDVTKPADTLIRKVFKVLGGALEPLQIKRVAQAEAEATIIKAQADIQIAELNRRAIRRLVAEETQKQLNIESITSQALPLLSDSATPDKLDDDWLSNYFEKCRVVSDREIQALWARVLAGEANSPGHFSRRTVNFLGDLDRVDAESLTKLCCFSWKIDGDYPLIFSTTARIYADNGVTFNSLIHLESIGLIQFQPLAGFTTTELPKLLGVTYFGESLTLNLPLPSGNELSIGHVLLTRTGKELASICGSRPVPGFVDYVRARWRGYLPETEIDSATPSGHE